MDRSVLKLYALCSIGPHCIAALLSLFFDTRAWYDIIAAVAILLPILTLILSEDYRFFYRGTLHIACILVAVVGQEVSRQSRSIDWNPLSEQLTGYIGLTMCIAHMAKGVGTFIKLLPSVKVLSQSENYKTSLRDYTGWIISLATSVYFLQEPNIYRNDKAMAEWRVTFACIETIHWSGLALSVSTYCHGSEWLITLLAPLQPLYSYALFQSLVTQSI